MKPKMVINLVVDTLKLAAFRRNPASGLIFHSDRGSQYCSDDLKIGLADFKIKISMSRKGDCWDNALTGSVWGKIKSRTYLRELICNNAGYNGLTKRLGQLL